MTSSRTWFQAASFASAMALTAVSWGQGYPSHPVRIVIPLSPGGTTDVPGRMIAQKLSEKLGQQFFVENRAGAGGTIGSDFVAKSRPDGYTLLLTATPFVITPHVYKKLPYDALADFTPVMRIAAGPYVLVVHSSLGVNSVKELIALAKAKPGSITFGSAGIGTQTHLAAENFLYTAGIEATHVPYKGEGPALAALVGGETNFMVTNVAAAMVHVKSGRLRALGVTSKDEFPQLAGVPPIGRTLPGFENSGWFGLVAPAGTPKPIIDKLYRDTRQALQDEKMRARFSAQGLEPVGNSPDEMGKAMREETQLWARVVKSRNIHVK